MRQQQDHKRNCSIGAKLLLAIIWILFSLILTACKTDMPVVNSIPVTVKSDCSRFSNIRQDNTDIQMQAIGDSLYVYVPASGNNTEYAVYRFHEKGVSKLENMLMLHRHRPLWNDSVVGFCNGYMYMIRHPGKDNETSYPLKAELIGYDLIAGTSETLIATEKAADLRVEMGENGELFVRTNEILNDTDSQSRIIHKNMLLPDETSEPRNVRTGSTAEILCNYNSESEMLSEDQLKSALASLTAIGLENNGCVMYPREDGLLLHMRKSRIPLCFVSSDGEVCPLIEYECLSSSSSFNYFGDVGFLSFVRYEKWDSTWGYFLEPYEDDSISGTYRIDLTDFAMEKISDKYYNGIFIFDESNLFVCDPNGGVYQMNHSGDLEATLIEP